MKFTILFALLLTGCISGPVDPEKICESALQGTLFNGGEQYTNCKRDVSRASFHAAHQAAQSYRNMPR